MKYRKKPVVIDAIQTTSANGDACIAFLGDSFAGYWDGAFQISTLEGVMAAPVGHWLIRGVKGERHLRARGGRRMTAVGRLLDDIERHLEAQ